MEFISQIPDLLKYLLLKFKQIIKIFFRTSVQFIYTLIKLS
jgi:hypothetical protein